MTRVKICGANSPAAFDAACAAGADWVGFVFAAGSPRQVTPAQAASLSARQTRGPGPKRVGLFVSPEDTDIEAALAALPLDVLQVYAPDARVAAIRGRFGLETWRSVPVRDAAGLPASADPADAVLIEPMPGGGDAQPGGNGRAWDWSQLGGWSPGFSWLLAGGLTPANVAAAIARSGAPAVDVSSGVESARGVKSAALIAAFVAAARA